MVVALSMPWLQLPEPVHRWRACARRLSCLSCAPSTSSSQRRHA